MKNQTNIAILSKYFLAVFLVAFFAVNWNEVSWIFNYKAVGGFASDFFKKEQALAEFGDLAENLSNNLEKNVNFEYSERENSIEIPKIEISVPLVVDSRLDDKEVFRALNRGTVYYPGSVLPGNNGQTIILGHSAPPGWPKIQYQWVFSRLNDLQEGDEIFVYFENKKYVYFVRDKIFLERGGELPEDLTNSENMLILISCWPPGKDIMRIAVRAVGYIE